MSIVLKENEWAADMIRMSSIGKKPSETLRRVARYYLDEGYNRKEVRAKLDIFVMNSCKNSSPYEWESRLDYALKSALKYPATNIDGIPITKKELETIEALDGKQIKRLAFTLLCLGKYWRTVIGDGDYWVNTKDSEILAMANINTSIKRQGAMLWTLREAGLVQFSKRVDNTNLKVLFVDEEGEPEITITDYRNLGYQYLKYYGGPYFNCVNCGITTKYNDPHNSRGQKYCPDCATKIYIQQTINSTMRHRAANTLN